MANFELLALVHTCHEVVPLLFFTFFPSFFLFLFLASVVIARVRRRLTPVFIFFLSFLPTAGQSSPRYRSDHEGQVRRGSLARSRPSSPPLDSTRLRSSLLRSSAKRTPVGYLITSRNSHEPNRHESEDVARIPTTSYLPS